jgi:short-subunit dehydrogenase
MRTILVVIVLLVALLAYHALNPLPAIDRKDFAHRYGPWCIVAGASEGLGEAFANELAANGLNLVLIARRENALNQVAEDIRKRHAVQVRTLVLDLSDTDTALKRINETISDIDVGSLVYNAAWAKVTHFDNHSTEEINTGINININTPTKLVHQLIPSLKKRGRGGILIVSSLAGIFGSRYIAVYTSTKSYQVTFAKGLWDEFRSSGIDVACAIPGAISTPKYSREMEEGGENVPGIQTPTEVAVESVQFLASRSGPIMVTGKLNRLMEFILQLLPTKITATIIGGNVKPQD